MNFPSVVPSARTFVNGEKAMTMYKSMTGKETRILLGDTEVEHQLTLTFSNVLEAGVKSIMDHWSSSIGRFEAFTLPSSVWSGWSQYQAAVKSGQKWRYEERPEVEAVAPGIMTVSVVLISVDG